MNPADIAKARPHGTPTELEAPSGDIRFHIKDECCKDQIWVPFEQRHRDLHAHILRFRCRRLVHHGADLFYWLTDEEYDTHISCETCTRESHLYGTYDVWEFDRTLALKLCGEGGVQVQLFGRPPESKPGQRDAMIGLVRILAGLDAFRFVVEQTIPPVSKEDLAKLQKPNWELVLAFQVNDNNIPIRITHAIFTALPAQRKK